jgi:hypothetical protein
LIGIINPFGHEINSLPDNGTSSQLQNFGCWLHPEQIRSSSLSFNRSTSSTSASTTAGLAAAMNSAS